MAPKASSSSSNSSRVTKTLPKSISRTSLHSVASQSSASASSSNASTASKRTRSTTVTQADPEAKRARSTASKLAASAGKGLKGALLKGKQKATSALRRLSRSPSPTSSSSDEDEDIAGIKDEVLEEDQDAPTAPKGEVSDQDKLHAASSKWTSPYYEFFEKPRAERTDGNEVVWIFHCAKRGCSHSVKRYPDRKSDKSSGGNFQRHAKACWGTKFVEDIVKDATRDDVRKTLKTHLKNPDADIRDFMGKSKTNIVYEARQHDQFGTRAQFVRWMSQELRPFEIAGDQPLKNLLMAGRPNYRIPHPTTVSRDCKVVFAEMRNRMAYLLREYEGDVSLATDCWTSPNFYAYMAITIHLIIDGQPVCFLLDFLEIPKSHTGENMAIEFAKVLVEFGIDSKVLGVTGDSASNNDTLVTELAKRIVSFMGEKRRVRCFAHTINLVAKAFLRLFDPPKRENGEDVDITVDDLERLGRGEEVEFDEEEKEILRDIMQHDKDDDDEMHEGDEDDVNFFTQYVDLDKVATEAVPIRQALGKIRQLSYKVIHSTTHLLPKWKDALTASNFRVRIIPRDVRTRWNSTYDMLHFALEYREAIDAFTGYAPNNLSDFYLQPAEWTLLQDICDLLYVLKQATLFFSAGAPTLSEVIPAMDDIDRVFQTAIVRVPDPESKDKTVMITRSLSESIKYSLLAAKKKLNIYYARTDESDLYRLAMVLHPEYKMEYFKENGWEDDWITKAQRLIRDVYDSSYAQRPVVRDDDEEADENDIPPAAVSGKTPPNMFAQRHRIKNKDADELTRYLSADCEHVENVIEWWTERKMTYPRLSRMALDFHTIPATSVDVERIFSAARRLITWERNRLSSQTVRALLCLRSWYNAGLVDDEDVARLVAGHADVIPEDIDDVDFDMPEKYDTILQ